MHQDSYSVLFKNLSRALKHGHLADLKKEPNEGILKLLLQSFLADVCSGYILVCVLVLDITT